MTFAKYSFFGLVLISVFLLGSATQIAVAYDEDPGDTTSNTPPTQTTDNTPPTQTTDNTPPTLGKIGGNPITLFNPLGTKSIGDIFLAILDIIMVFAVPIILFFIVWAGFLYVTAQGDTAQVEKATKALTYAVIGGLLVLGAQALLFVITNTINLFT